MVWGCSVRELLARVTSVELTELMAYDNLEPFGWPMDNWRMGQICATTMNARVVARPLPRSYPKDFVPIVRREMSVEEMISNLKLATGG